jgi:hypothetical protein
MVWLTKSCAATKRGGGLHVHMHRSSLSACCFPLYASERRGPSKLITPSELHLGHQTLSPSKAALAPLMDLEELAEVTLPPAVVGAPSVMRYRFMASRSLLDLQRENSNLARMRPVALRKRNDG